MPANNRNTGRDITIDLATANGPLPFPPTILSIDAKPKYKTIDSHPINGVPQETNIPVGWEIDIEFERAGPTFDAYAAALEAAYFSGQNLQPGTINETIQEPTGGISQWRYTNVVVRLDDAGSFKGDALVHQKVRAFASNKIQVQ
ncbi:hypothetical protein EO087_00240 [Dyella sp. M7H15-1]|uniref:hypothetical protein n=1 Tax=Dyella sp. M7H15-1 TaxID=2501295 RepID=UPI001004F47F|nr:hypothetical protein [Dyella sp. M7H15-1]QAU22594.1 hypothetical protein EO087_00240 [Dyella sp. M7H15-1]